MDQVHQQQQQKLRQDYQQKLVLNLERKRYQHYYIQKQDEN